MARTNFFYLLFALLLLLTVIPIADQLGAVNAPIVRTFVFSSLLIIGVWSLKGGGRYFAVGMTFAVIGVILNIIAARSHAESIELVSFLALIGFLLVATAYTLRQIAVGRSIDANRLAGAVCVYLLLGVIWAMLYTLVNLLSPGAFAGFSPSMDRSWDSEWLYFSFVTMTTLGYGDILPVSAIARGLAYLQALAGQFYIAILVAGLVGAYISERQQGESGG
jgi:hypothetical protein